MTTAWGAHVQAKHASKLVLTVAGLGYQTAKQLPQEGLDEFTRRTGIQVDFLPAWGNSTDQLALTRRTLEGRFPTPDIYVIDAIWPSTLYQHLLDLKPYLDKKGDEKKHDELPPELLKNDTVKGRLVALPFYLNLGMLYYRTDLLQKYGYSRPPNTWSELERMAARIQKGERSAGHSGFWGYVFQGAPYEGLTCNALEWQVSFGGGRIIEPDGTVTVNNAQTAHALRKAAGWINSISPASVLSYTESDSLNAFRNGNAAFLRYWTSGFSQAGTSAVVRGHIGVALLPAGPHGRAQTMGGFQVAVSAHSIHPREASELVLFLTGSSIQKSRAIREGYLPSLPALYTDPELLEAVPEAGLVKTLPPESWISRPSAVAADHYADVSRIYYEGVHAILSHQGRAEDVLKTTEKQLLALTPAFHLKRN